MAQDQPTSASDALAPRTLWLDIRFADERWTFELGPDEDRAIVVGSLLRAHVRIDRRGIAPVHFHFEREGDAVRLIPAYRADLCVNGVAVAGPHPIDQHAVVEFSGVRLQAHVLENEPGVSEDLHLRDWTRDELPNCGALLALPDCADPTRIAFRRASSEPPADPGGLETQSFRPLFDVHLGRHQNSTCEAERPEPEVSEGTTRTLADQARPIAPQAIIQLEARAPSQSANESFTAVADPLACAGRHQRLGGTVSEAAEAHALPGFREFQDANLRDEHPSTAPLCTNIPRSREGLPFLARIGVAARRRPLGAALGAVGGSLVLTLAMLGLGRISSPSKAHRGTSACIVPSSLRAVGSSRGIPSPQFVPAFAAPAEPSPSSQATTAVAAPEPASSSVSEAALINVRPKRPAARQRQSAPPSAPRSRQHPAAAPVVLQFSPIATQGRR